MARRKRASMREGPLADLFRSTVEPEDPPEAPAAPGRESEAETSVYREAEDAPEAPAPAPEPEPEPEPVSEEEEPVRAYRGGEAPLAPPPPRERLNRIFTDDSLDIEG